MQVENIRTFGNSSFKQWLDCSDIPEHQDQLMRAVREIVEWFCKTQKIEIALGKIFFAKLQKQAFEKEDLLIGKIPSAAQR